MEMDGLSAKREQNKYKHSWEELVASLLVWELTNDLLSTEASATF